MKWTSGDNRDHRLILTCDTEHHLMRFGLCEPGWIDSGLVVDEMQAVKGAAQV